MGDCRNFDSLPPPIVYSLNGCHVQQIVSDRFTDWRVEDKFSCDRENCITWHLQVRVPLQLNVWGLTVCVDSNSFMERAPSKQHCTVHQARDLLCCWEINLFWFIMQQIKIWWATKAQMINGKHFIEITYSIFPSQSTQHRRGFVYLFLILRKSGCYICYLHKYVCKFNICLADLLIGLIQLCTLCETMTWESSCSVVYAAFCTGRTEAALLLSRLVQCLIRLQCFVSVVWRNINVPATMSLMKCACNSYL